MSKKTNYNYICSIKSIKSHKIQKSTIRDPKSIQSISKFRSLSSINENFSLLFDSSFESFFIPVLGKLVTGSKIIRKNVQPAATCTIKRKRSTNASIQVLKRLWKSRGVRGRKEPQLVALSTVNTAIIGKDIRRSVIYRSGVNPDWQPQLSN